MLDNYSDNFHGRKSFVTLVEWHSGFCNVSNTFKVQQPNGNIDGYNETVAEYHLPDGYLVLRSNWGDLNIFTFDGVYCEIYISDKSGKPVIHSMEGYGHRHVLSRTDG